MGRATLKDVANLAGVSPSTVSRVVNNTGLTVKDETRKRIFEAIRVLNYTPNGIARSLRTNLTHQIGMLIPDITNPFFPTIFKGAEIAAHQRGFNIVLCNTDDNAKKVSEQIHLLLERKVDGLLLVTDQINDDLAKKIERNNCPFVFVHRMPRTTEVGYYVAVNNLRGGKKATEHLINLGHRLIAHIAGPLYANSAVARLEGYRLALKENGLPFTSDLLVESEYYSEETGYKAAVKLLQKKPHITSIFASNDLIAIGVMKAAQKLGLDIPGDISLIGFNDMIFMSELRVPLTTMRVPLFDMGTLGAKLIIDLIKGDNPKEKKIILETELIIRKSTKPI